MPDKVLRGLQRAQGAASWYGIFARPTSFAGRDGLASGRGSGNFSWATTLSRRIQGGLGTDVFLWTPPLEWWGI